MTSIMAVALTTLLHFPVPLGHLEQFLLDSQLFPPQGIHLTLTAARLFLFGAFGVAVWSELRSPDDW